MKKIILCDNIAQHITEEDFEMLKFLSPGTARLVSESDNKKPTHFVCPKCGQVAPVRLKKLHCC